MATVSNDVVAAQARIAELLERNAELLERNAMLEARLRHYKARPSLIPRSFLTHFSLIPHSILHGSSLVPHSSSLSLAHTHSPHSCPFE